MGLAVATASPVVTGCGDSGSSTGDPGGGGNVASAYGTGPTTTGGGEGGAGGAGGNMTASAYGSAPTTSGGEAGAGGAGGAP